MKMHMADGTIQIESYDEVCNNLGFNPDVHFVEITNRGTITFTCGKPNEIQALRNACKKCGYKASKSLMEA